MNYFLGKTVIFLCVQMGLFSECFSQEKKETEVTKVNVKYSNLLLLLNKSDRVIVYKLNGTGKGDLIVVNRATEKKFLVNSKKPLPYKHDSLILNEGYAISFKSRGGSVFTAVVKELDADFSFKLMSPEGELDLLDVFSIYDDVVRSKFPVGFDKLKLNGK